MGFKQNTRPRWQNWIPVFALMCIAALIRLKLTSAETYYLLEGDGPYYPLQARSLFEKMRLGLPDVPLLFTLDCLVAKLLHFFTVYSIDECIMMGIRFTDVFVPPLSAIPVFLIYRELRTEESKVSFRAYLVVAFAILNFSTVLIFPNCLHKNAVAVVWVCCYFLFVIRFIKYAQNKHLYYALFALALCALTHFGSFSILLLFSIIAGFFWFLQSRNNSDPAAYRKMFITLSCVVVLIFGIVIFDYSRFKRLFSIPLNIFEAPLILFAADGQNIAAYTNIFNLLAMNLIWIVALLGLFFARRKLSSIQRTLSCMFLLFTFLITNPFLGIEWADRLYIMAFMPITVICFLFFVNVRNKGLKILQSAILVVMVILSIIFGLTQPYRGIITEEALSEFKTVNNTIAFSEKSVIIGNRALRLLGSWYFRTKSIADYSLTKNNIGSFDAFYVIRQLEGNNALKNYQRGSGEIPFNSLRVYKGMYFEVYKLTDLTGWAAERNDIPKLRGSIVSVEGNMIIIMNKWSGSKRPVRITSSTAIHLNAGDTLKEGQYVEVWGKGRPFSLVVDAEEIMGKKYQQ